MVVEINESPPVDDNQVDTVLVRLTSSPASTTITAVTTRGMQARRQFRRAHANADKIIIMLEKTMEREGVQVE
jgi:hypothetical protein